MLDACAALSSQGYSGEGGFGADIPNLENLFVGKKANHACTIFISPEIREASSQIGFTPLPFPSSPFPPLPFPSLSSPSLPHISLPFPLPSLPHIPLPLPLPSSHPFTFTFPFTFPFPPHQTNHPPVKTPSHPPSAFYPPLPYPTLRFTHTLPLFPTSPPSLFTPLRYLHHLIHSYLALAFYAAAQKKNPPSEVVRYRPCALLFVGDR